MPFVAIANCAKVDVNVDDFHTVFHIAKAAAAPFTGADCLNAAQNIFGSWASGIMPECSSEVSLKSVTVTALDTVTSPQATYGPSSVPGTVGSHALPPQVSVCITIYSLLRSRSGRGRMFLTGLPISAVSVGGVPVGSVVSALAAGINAVHTALLADTPSMEIVVASRIHASYSPANAIVARRTIFAANRRREALAPL